MRHNSHNNTIWLQYTIYNTKYKMNMICNLSQKNTQDLEVILALCNWLASCRFCPSSTHPCTHVPTPRIHCLSTNLDLDPILEKPCCTKHTYWKALNDSRFLHSRKSIQLSNLGTSIIFKKFSFIIKLPLHIFCCSFFGLTLLIRFLEY